jgi:hypothetical protein
MSQETIQEIQETVTVPPSPPPPLLSLSFKWQDMPIAPPLALGKANSVAYRHSSKLERSETQDMYEHHKLAAMKMAEDCGMTVDEAMEKLNPNWADDKWKVIELEKDDLTVGQLITTSEFPGIVTNSKLKNGEYNDTIVMMVSDEKTECVTYLSRSSENAFHSGDIRNDHLDYNLRHTIKVTPSKKTGALISSGWKNRASIPIGNLIPTEPVLEIRTSSSEEKKRYVIPQDFSEGDNHTACVSAVFWYTEETKMWSIKLVREFIFGFADTPDILETYVKKIVDTNK